MVFHVCLSVELGRICIPMAASLCLKSCEDHSSGLCMLHDLCAASFSTNDLDLSNLNTTSGEFYPDFVR